MACFGRHGCQWVKSPKCIESNKKFFLNMSTMCRSRKYPYPSTTEDSLICTPPPPRIFHSRGVFDDSSSPQEFPEFLNGDFAHHPLEIQSGFGTLKTKKVNTNSVSYENTVESYYNSAVQRHYSAKLFSFPTMNDVHKLCLCCFYVSL